MKQWLLGMLVLAAGLGLAQQRPEDIIKAQCEKAEVVAELWHGFRGGAPKDALDNLAVEFNRTQGGKVCVRPVSQGNYRDLSTKIKASFASGKIPVMAQAFENNMALYLESDALLPIPSLGVDLKGVNPLFANAVKINGQIYGVPFNKSIQLLYVNRDLLKKYNARVPLSIPEFVETAKKISEGEKQPVYWFVPDASTYAYWFFTLGGNYLQNGKLVLNSAKGLEALEFLVKAVKDGWAKPITNGFINENFGSGVFGFSTDSSAGYSFYARAAKFDVGVATLPGRTDKQPGFGLVQGTNIVVFKGADDKEKRVAADFLRFIISPKAQAVFGVAANYVPVNQGSGVDPVVTRFVKENPAFGVAISQARFARFEPALSQWEQIRFDILGQAIKEAVLGQATPKAALDKAQKAAEDLLAGRTR
ncbi:ABC transporter substrate-binding protein [Meiothermus hypogaeus]|uniref:ABC transporter substrate-binding protein n=2 Tax=Meiothermus hypogaeus TaxID=884155 RepID=A0A511R3H2_9DEIN|nr:ABC transporter substrate-binding protein [Meiothermus hypogaeus]RIH78826.1 sn-glycerol-3-phosphate-binding periplasmic protein UgpB [Meiothermus hypogaeus]GEM84171.1 ABC transporter substrate-binding protein [Meiothermus hypogaeus NBRC 106114]